MLRKTKTDFNTFITKCLIKNMKIQLLMFERAREQKVCTTAPKCVNRLTLGQISVSSSLHSVQFDSFVLPEFLTVEPIIWRFIPIIRLISTFIWEYCLALGSFDRFAPPRRKQINKKFACLPGIRRVVSSLISRFLVANKRSLDKS